MDEDMREELSDIVEASVESAVEVAFEEKLEDISWELREQVQDAYDNEADAIEALEKVKDAIERGDALIEL